MSAIQDSLRPAGVQAAQIYDLWLLMLVVCTIVFAAVFGAFVMALWRAPRATERTAPDVAAISSQEPKSLLAVSIGLIVSAVGLIALIIASVLTDRALAALPLKDGLVIEVTARQWWWDIVYDDHEPSRIFRTANELHIPVGRPVVIKLKSSDVIHSFWVPNLHGKKDLIPGHTSLIQLRADQPGVYRGQCAEFCGHQHAKMAFLVIAHEPQDFERWAQSQRQPAKEPEGELQKRGREVFLSSPCIMCHRIDGTVAQGRQAPDLTHLASRRTIAAGTLPNTRGNLGGWILDPQSTKPGVMMPPVALAAADLQALLAYLESLH
ncbi:MAG TPA: cytochrome c oxidase subunit II [Burkholderiales bacterium]|nr:cytochrome c oxidase subunit II [Burkholderiales bacterium]